MIARSSCANEGAPLYRSTTPRVSASGVIALWERRLISALNVGRSRTTVKQCASIEQLARDLLSNKKYKGVQHLVRLTRDEFERNAPIEDAKAFSREYDAMVDSWYAERCGTRIPSLAEVHCAEEHAEGMKEEAETEFSYDRSPRNAAKLLSAIEAHRAADELLARVARAALNGVRV